MENQSDNYEYMYREVEHEVNMHRDVRIHTVLRYMKEIKLRTFT